MCWSIEGNERTAGDMDRYKALIAERDAALARAKKAEAAFTELENRHIQTIVRKDVEIARLRRQVEAVENFRGCGWPAITDWGKGYERGILDTRTTMKEAANAE